MRFAWRWSSAALFGIALIVRLLAIMALPPMTITPDLEEYRYLGHAIATRGEYGFRDDWRDNPVLGKSPWPFYYDKSGMVRSPGYPLMLAGLELIGGADAALQYLLAVVDALSAVIIGHIASALFGGSAGPAAMLLYAIDPNALQCINLRAREPVLTLLVSLAVLAMLKTAGQKKTPHAGMAGVLWALATMVKETVGVMAVIGAVWLAWRGRFDRRSVRLAVIMLLPSVILSGPWLVRNTMVVGHVAGVSTMAGVGMWAGLVDDSLVSGHGLRWTEDFDPGDRIQLDPYTAGSAVEADRRLVRLVWKYAVRHPADVARHLVSNMLLFWSPVSRTVATVGFAGRRLEVVSLLYFATVYVLAALAIWHHRSRSECHLTIAVLAATTLAHALFWSAVRYRLQVEMFVMPFAAAGLYGVVTRFAPTPAPRRTPSP